MSQFLKDFREALYSCIELGIAVPFMLFALFGPTILIILGILWATGVI